MPQSSNQSASTILVPAVKAQQSNPVIPSNEEKPVFPPQPDPNLHLKPNRSQVPQKYGGRKIIATIFGIGLLLVGVTSTIYLVQRQQLLTGKAADCSAYTFSVTRDGTVTVQNGSSQTWAQQKADVFVNEILVETYEVPEVENGSASTLGTVKVPLYDGFTWKVEGRTECQNNGKFETRMNEL